jgi:shikimate kinase
MQPGKLFYFIGLPGCGKSYALQLLLDKPDVVGIDMDAHIQYLQNDTIANIVSKHGWDYFRKIEQEALQELTATYLQDSSNVKIIACGGGTPCFFDNINYMKKHGTIVWFNTNLEINVTRLLGTENVRPMLAENQQQVMIDFLTNLLSERKPFYEQATIVLTEPVEDANTLYKVLGL